MTPEPDQAGARAGWLSRHPVVVLLVALAVTVVAVRLAFQLKLKTAITELLPSSDPGVVALHNTEKRLGDMSMLLVGIHSPDPEANVRYAEMLTQKIRALPKNRPAIATYHVRDVRDFFEQNKWLYLSESDLEDIRDRLRKEISRHKNPLFVDLGGDDEPIEAMRSRIAGKQPLGARFPDGLLARQDKTYLWIAMLPPGGLFVEGSGEGLLHDIDRLIKENPPAAYHPALRVQPGGPVTTAIAARKAVEDDLKLVTATCLLLVGFSIWLFFPAPAKKSQARSAPGRFFAFLGRQFLRGRALMLVGIPAIIGTTSAFAVADIAFGYLTSSTAFLGSIIIGNGINYGIVLMSRYEEERSRGSLARAAISRAVAGTWRATAVAALSASAAYASLMVTSFRGFYQFGVMGAVGAVMCWIATYTVLPTMLLLLDGRKTGPALSRPPLRLAALGSLVGRWYRPLLVVFGLTLAVSMLGLTHFLRDPFEYDFRKLNANVNTTPEAESFSKGADDLFGRWPSPTIILADRPEDVEDIRQTIRRQDDERALTSTRRTPTIGQIATVWDLLPGTLEVQARKLALITSIRKLVHDPVLEVLNEKERADLAKINPPADLRQVGPRDLPPIAQRPFTEADGTVGRVVLVYPVEHGISVWNGRDLLEIASVLQHLHLANGTTLDTSGSAVVFGSMIRSILHDGPIATLASLVAVLLIVSIMMRPARSAVLTLVTLLVGVVWMVGAAGWAGVRVTFLNFIALPITFGIGAEYALNVVSRIREDKDVVKAVTSTGAAVALCSWTTIVGYGSLLAASSQALRGFGMMAILGEIACLTAAIMGLPVALRWWASRGRVESLEQKPPPSEPATNSP